MMARVSGAGPKSVQSVAGLEIINIEKPLFVVLHSKSDEAPIRPGLLRREDQLGAGRNATCVFYVCFL